MPGDTPHRSHGSVGEKDHPRSTKGNLTASGDLFNEEICGRERGKCYFCNKDLTLNATPGCSPGMSL